MDTAGVAGLRQDPRVERVAKAPELSLIRPVASRPARRSRKLTWGIERLEAQRLWDAGIDGQGVVVGHLDTGVDGAHPALRGAIAAFTTFDQEGNQVPGASAADSGEHGTHTAGTIVGRKVTQGSFGVAPGAKLASAMVIEGGQVIERVLGGMEWILDQGCRILSMSLGLRGFTPAFETVIIALRNAGTLPVIAVGNEGPDTSRSPGNYPTVLSVGAMDRHDAVADFSGSQRFRRQADPLVPDLVAPGVGVFSCVPNRGFAEMDGSSMATPHIAGLAALLLQAKPDATVEDLEKAILQSGHRPVEMPESRSNRGVPNAPLAFQILTGHALPSPAPTSRRRRATAGKPRSTTRRTKPVSRRRAAPNKRRAKSSR